MISCYNRFQKVFLGARKIKVDRIGLNLFLDTQQNQSLKFDNDTEIKEAIQFSLQINAGILVVHAQTLQLYLSSLNF